MSGDTARGIVACWLLSAGTDTPHSGKAEAAYYISTGDYTSCHPFSTDFSVSVVFFSFLLLLL